jgi:hypothetical protein
MSYEIAIINPRRKSAKRRRKASAKQIAARRRFVAKFAKGRKARRSKLGRRSKPRRIKSGVPAMAKRRRRRSAKRSTKGRFVKKSKSATKRVRRRRRSGGARKTAVGYTVGSRRIRRRKLNPIGRRRRRYSRNPISARGIFGHLVPAAYGAAGAVALNLGLSYLPLPDSLKTGWARHGVRLAGAFAVGYAAKKFLGNKGQAVAAGALTVAMYDLFKEVINMAAPAIGTRLGEFEDVSLADDGFIDPASPVRGLSAYLQGDMDDQSDGSADGSEAMGAYLQGNLDGNLDAYNYV